MILKQGQRDRSHTGKALWISSRDRNLRFLYEKTGVSVGVYEEPAAVRRVLNRLRGDLESTFMVIAYAGHSNKPDFIEQRQEQFRKNYRKYFSVGLSPKIGDAEQIFGAPYRGTVIESPEVSAYSNFMRIDPKGNPEDIAQTCEDLLADIREPEPDEVYDL
jgi:hypothetical protein